MGQLVAHDARSSRGLSIPRMPSVTQTAAFCGLRPVANALGWRMADVQAWHGLPRLGRQLTHHGVELRQLRSVTGCAPIVRSAILSDQKYVAAFMPRR